MQTWLRNNVLNGRRDGMCSSGAKACSYGAVSGAVKFADADQAPLAADRAEGDIHAGEPQDAFGRGLLLRRRFLLWRFRQRWRKHCTVLLHQHRQERKRFLLYQLQERCKGCNGNDHCYAGQGIQTGYSSCFG